ncbi:hypothetical protein ILUMI_18648 [Ignelater luminosus]|uniref:THAP-type domain-containing protein n=1 Tax=Ignelater luminosus TaxID=2038154 RepID=A0A8K0CHU1_IGNLU|nr:hypothetical protein ILUMI_18648 [Ignelater luminosus]
MASRGGTVCAYRGCSSKTGGEISLFAFPKNPARIELWLKACNRQDLLGKTLRKNYKLCEKHFEEKYISKGNGTRKRLFAQAMPTIFPHLLKCGVPEDTEQPMENVVIIVDTPSTETCCDLPTHAGLEPSSEIFSLSDPLLCEETSSDSLYCEETEFSIVPSDKPTSPIGSHVSTQTPASLSSGTPRKQKLRAKLTALRRKMYNKRSVSSQRSKWNLQDFKEMCDEFLNESLAQFVKSQAALKEDRKKEEMKNEETVLLVV